MPDREPLWVVGYHAVQEALDGDRSVELLWILHGRGDRRASRLIATAQRAGVKIARVDRRELDRVANGVAHNGCAARVAPVAYVDLDALIAPRERQVEWFWWTT